MNKKKEKLTNLTEKLRIINFKFALEKLAKEHEILHLVACFETESISTRYFSKSPLAQQMGMVRGLDIDLANEYCKMQPKEKK